jgi:hypothetical protein
MQNAWQSASGILVETESPYISLAASLGSGQDESSLLRHAATFHHLADVCCTWEEEKQTNQ